MANSKSKKHEAVFIKNYDGGSLFVEVHSDGEAIFVSCFNGLSCASQYINKEQAEKMRDELDKFIEGAK